MGFVVTPVIFIKRGWMQGIIAYRIVIGAGGASSWLCIQSHSQKSSAEVAKWESNYIQLHL